MEPAASSPSRLFLRLDPASPLSSHRSRITTAAVVLEGMDNSRSVARSRPARSSSSVAASSPARCVEPASPPRDRLPAAAMVLEGVDKSRSAARSSAMASRPKGRRGKSSAPRVLVDEYTIPGSDQKIKGETSTSIYPSCELPCCLDRKKKLTYYIIWCTYAIAFGVGLCSIFDFLVYS